MPRAVGIDFGTTKTIVSRYNTRTDQAETILLPGYDAAPVPTTISVADNRFLFGNDAEDDVILHPSDYCRGFKLSLGMNDAIVGGLNAKQLTRRFLRALREICSERGFIDDEKVEDVIITIPVAFSPAQIQELQDAAKDAGFNRVETLMEPVAAGRAYLKEQGGRLPYRNVLVVDWGGGTVDIAVLSVGDTIQCNPKNTDGDDSVGGDAIDRKLWDTIRKRFSDEHGMKIPARRGEIPGYLRDVEKAKKKLDSKDFVDFYPRGESLKKIRLTRTDFENLAKRFVIQVVQKIKRVVDPLPAEHIPDAILLIGGTCRMPLVKKAIKDAFGLMPITWSHSREAVALGAAYEAHRRFCTDNSSNPSIPIISNLIISKELRAFINGRCELQRWPICQFLYVLSASGDKEAYHYFEEFVKQNDINEGKKFLGQLRARSDKVPSDADSSPKEQIATEDVINVNVLRAQALKDDSDAQLLLAAIYAQGCLGVKKDKSMARMWIKEAFSKSSEEKESINGEKIGDVEKSLACVMREAGLGSDKTFHKPTNIKLRIKSAMSQSVCKRNADVGESTWSFVKQIHGEENRSGRVGISELLTAVYDMAEPIMAYYQWCGGIYRCDAPLHSGLAFFGSLDQKKITNARASMHVGENELELLQGDSTAFGGAREGFICTNRGIYWKNSDPNHIFVPWDNGNKFVGENRSIAVMDITGHKVGDIIFYWTKEQCDKLAEVLMEIRDFIVRNNCHLENWLGVGARNAWWEKRPFLAREAIINQHGLS